MRSYAYNSNSKSHLSVHLPVVLIVRVEHTNVRIVAFTLLLQRSRRAHALYRYVVPEAHDSKDPKEFGEKPII